VTDAAGKWKQFTSDAFGNLTTVTEPNPVSSFRDRLRNPQIPESLPRERAMNAGQLSLGIE
jgi:hypothetical protein